LSPELPYALIGCALIAMRFSAWIKDKWSSNSAKAEGKFSCHFKILTLKGEANGFVQTQQ
jgi:hypothetical protein